MDFLFKLQTFAWFGILGWVLYLAYVKDQSWENLISEKVLTCFAVMYLVAGIPIWIILHPIFSSISTTSNGINGRNGLFEYVTDNQGFEWPGGGFVLIWNIITLIAAEIITSYIHNQKHQD